METIVKIVWELLLIVWLAKLTYKLSFQERQISYLFKKTEKYEELLFLRNKKDTT